MYLILFKDSGTDIEKMVCQKILFVMKYASFQQYWSYLVGVVWKNIQLTRNSTAVLAGNHSFLVNNTTKNHKIHNSAKTCDISIK